MTNNYNKYLNNESSIIVRNNLYNQDEFIEITNLPKFNGNILVDYGSNNNPLNNDSVTINQLISDPLIHTIEINNYNYNLVQIEWRKTNFTFNGNKVGLTLHLIHSDYETSKKLNIIIPLDLVDEQIESFINTNYIKMDNYFKKPSDPKNKNKIINNVNELKGEFNLLINYKRKYNIKNININSLLKNKDDIPNYQCCKNTIGNRVHINMCLLKPIIELNDVCYIIEEENGNTNLIMEPNIFNEDIGLLIRSYINKDINLLYLK